MNELLLGNSNKITPGHHDFHFINETGQYLCIYDLCLLITEIANKFGSHWVEKNDLQQFHLSES